MHCAIFPCHYLQDTKAKKVIWLHISSGRGPEECCHAVENILRIVSESANKNKLNCELLESVEEKIGLASALISIEGPGETEFTDSWCGTILWKCSSPFRKNHKRKNWYISIQILPQLKKGMFLDKDLRFTATTAGGPGGQHANRSKTAIKVEHIPTGLSANSGGERSQKMNREIALARLQEKFQQTYDKQDTAHKTDKWELHNQLERGNPVRIFEGPRFKEIFL